MIVHMIGNAHIDPVWLWRWQAGVDEALATFRSAADRCEEYPEFVFTRGESWVYEQVERLDPGLFERVRGYVKSGQWHITGGQYLQPDANLPTEAGWRRQILHGQRYFEDRFGVRPNIGYNVDTFGHPSTLPDVLSSLGHIAYVFHRPGAYQMDLPSQTFRWRGSGGGKVLGFRIAPNYVTHADNLYGQIIISAEAADPDLGHTMCQTLEAGKLNKLARQQAQPPVVFDRYEGLDRPPWGNSPPRPLWLASEQRAVEDGKMPHL